METFLCLLQFAKRKELKNDESIKCIDRKLQKAAKMDARKWSRIEQTRGPEAFQITNKHNAHSCVLCKEEVLKTRNLLAESLLHHLEGLKNEKNLKLVTPESNCVECCYHIYGPQFPKFGPQGVSVTAYDSQTYNRYSGQQALQQYNCQIDPQTISDLNTQLEYGDPNVFYPDYDTMSYYNGCRSTIVDRRASRHNFGPQSSVASLAGEPSKRPIRCPTHLCGRNIAVTALTSHFCFDHPDVPPVNVDFDVSSHLFVVPDVIPFNYGRCVAMLLIPNRLEPVNSISHSNITNSSKGKDPLPLVVMASRLDCVTNPHNSDGFEESNRSDSLSQGDFRMRERRKADSSPSKDLPSESLKTPLLVIWLAGLETNSSLFTTLQVTEKQTNIRSVVYTGPITSLRSSQSTTKVFEQGDCLVIHSGILESIIGDRGGFDLHVVVH